MFKHLLIYMLLLSSFILHSMERNRLRDTSSEGDLSFFRTDSDSDFSFSHESENPNTPLNDWDSPEDQRQSPRRFMTYAELIMSRFLLIQTHFKHYVPRCMDDIPGHETQEFKDAVASKSEITMLSYIGKHPELQEPTDLNN